jgi:hypothetical protein
MFRPIRMDHTNCLQVVIKTHSFIETNRLFARTHNPEIESMAEGPGIFNVFKRHRSINTYGQLAAYKSACSKLVPKPVAPPKTDWRSGSAVRAAKPKKQVSQQQMDAPSASARPQAGHGHGGHRPPASVPVVAVAVPP